MYAGGLEGWDGGYIGSSTINFLEFLSSHSYHLVDSCPFPSKSTQSLAGQYYPGWNQARRCCREHILSVIDSDLDELLLRDVNIV
jgi:hypothetical protein